MRMRCWAAAAAMVVSAWAGSAGAATYTLNLAFTDGGPTTQSFAPITLLPGDRLNFTIDFNTSQVHSKWYPFAKITGQFGNGETFSIEGFVYDRTFFGSYTSVLHYYDYVMHPWGSTPSTWVYAKFQNPSDPGMFGYLAYGSFVGGVEPLEISQVNFQQTWADVSAAVPEPSTWALMLAGVVLLALHQRANRHARAGGQRRREA